MHESGERDAFDVEVTALGDRHGALRRRREVDGEMARSLRRHGQLSPVLCYRDADGALEVVDGFRRLRVARQSGVPSRLQVRVLLQSATMRVGRHWIEQSPFTLEPGQARVVRALIGETRHTVNALLTLMDHSVERAP